MFRFGFLFECMCTSLNTFKTSIKGIVYPVMNIMNHLLTILNLYDFFFFCKTQKVFKKCPYHEIVVLDSFQENIFQDNFSTLYESCSFLNHTLCHFRLNEVLSEFSTD